MKSIIFNVFTFIFQVIGNFSYKYIVNPRNER